MFPLVPSRVAASDTRPRRSFRLSPAQTIVAGFGLADLVGTGLLMLPAATRDGEGASFVHALFTSTSAVCVTGLVVVDTETYWTPLGHLVILALIQIGGIGIMVFASLVGVLLARRLSVAGWSNCDTDTVKATAANVLRAAHTLADAITTDIPATAAA
jgi:Trk-type K+ transport system membrane component